MTRFKGISIKKCTFSNMSSNKDLISTNILQRGIGNCNPMKMAKYIIELERIYGIKNGGGYFGGNQYIKNEELTNNSVAPNQEELAKQIGISTDTLQNYKKLTILIPELQSMVENDTLKSTTAYKIWAKLSSDEQKDFFDKIGQENIKKLTQKQTIEEINKINREKQQIEEENKVLEQGKVFAEYEKLCGVRQGRPNKTGQNVRTQEDIAKELGVDVRTIQRLPITI